MRTIKECEQVAREHGGKLGWYAMHVGGYAAVISFKDYGEMRMCHPEQLCSLVFNESDKCLAYNHAADWAEKYLKPKGE